MGLLSWQKFQAFDIFRSLRARVEKEMGNVINTLYTDRGGEYTSDSFGDYCTKEGIKQHKTTTPTCQQNGVGEQKNMTTMEMSLAMLRGKDLSWEYWSEAVNTTVHVLN